MWSLESGVECISRYCGLTERNWDGLEGGEAERVQRKESWVCCEVLQSPQGWNRRGEQAPEVVCYRAGDELGNRNWRRGGRVKTTHLISRPEQPVRFQARSASGCWHLRQWDGVTGKGPRRRSKESLGREAEKNKSPSSGDATGLGTRVGNWKAGRTAKVPYL